VLAGASADGAEVLVPGTTGALRWLVPGPPAFIEAVLGSDGRWPADPGQSDVDPRPRTDRIMTRWQA